jgi:hypothetical protein
MNQHYVPKLLLKRFRDPETGRLWRYQRGCDEITSITVKNAAQLPDFYATCDEQGNLDSTTLEATLQKGEVKVAPLLRRPLAVGTLSMDDRLVFARFLAQLITRARPIRDAEGEMWNEFFRWFDRPGHRYHDEVQRQVRDHAEKTGLPEDGIWAAVREHMKAKQTDARRRRPVSTSVLLDAENWDASIASMKWTIIKAATNRTFVISDDPVFRCKKKPGSRWFTQCGAGDQSVEMTVPLSKRHVLLCTRLETMPAEVNASDSLLEEINKRTVISADIDVFASENTAALRQLVHRYEKDDRVRYTLMQSGRTVSGECLWPFESIVDMLSP